MVEDYNPFRDPDSVVNQQATESPMKDNYNPFRDRVTEEERTPNYGALIANELVKSYGLRRDAATGEWSLTLDNIGQAFKEDPFWTTVDYLTLAVPAAKWGGALARAAKGAKMIRAGEDGIKLGAGVAAGISSLQNEAGYFVMKKLATGGYKGAKAQSITGRALQSLGRHTGLLNPDTVAAAEGLIGAGSPVILGTAADAGTSLLRGHKFRLEGRGGGSLFEMRRGAGLAPAEKEALKAAGKAGELGIEDAKTLNAVLYRETQVAKSIGERQAEEILRATKTTQEEVKPLLHDALKSGARLENSPVWGQLTAREQAGWKSLQYMAADIHYNSFKLGAINKEQFLGKLTESGKELWRQRAAGIVAGDTNLEEEFIHLLGREGGNMYSPRVLKKYYEQGLDTGWKNRVASAVGKFSARKLDPATLAMEVGGQGHLFLPILR